MDDALLFSGIRWGGAKVVDRKLEPVGGSKELFGNTLIIGATGEGRAYTVDVAEAWWRDFSEIPLADEKPVLSFLRRRGDPLGLLAPGRQISTLDWLPLQGHLRAAATVWDPQPDETGVSHFRAAELKAVEVLFNSSKGWKWPKDLGVIYCNAIRAEHAKTLAAYMWASAAAALRGRRPMRRCDFCHSWFTSYRSDARVCGPSCRAARSNKRISPHVIVS